MRGRTGGWAVKKTKKKRNDRLSIPVIVDGNNLVCRCGFASSLQELSIHKKSGAATAATLTAIKGKKGKAPKQLTGGLYTSIRSVLSVLKTLFNNPNLGPVIMCYDGGRHPKRSELFPQYKQNREGRRDEEQVKQVRRQLKLSKKFFRALGCRVVEVPEREADDCIAQMVHMLHDRGVEPVVVSGDYDLLQLMTKARVYNLNVNEIASERFMQKKFGVSAEHYIFFKSIISDVSDNIPGIPGVGKKTVADFVSAFGGLIPKGVSPPKAIRRWLTKIEEDGLELMTVRSKSILEHKDHIVKVCRAVSLHNPDFKGAKLRKLVRRTVKKRRFNQKKFEKLCKKFNFRSLSASADIEPIFGAVNSKDVDL